MTSDLAAPRAIPSELGSPESVERYARAARAKETIRSQRTGWGQFVAFCAARGENALPADPLTVCAFLAALADAGRRPEAIDRRLSAISRAHKLAGFASPRLDERVRLTRAGIRRTVGVQPSQKRPVSLADLRAMVRAQPDTTRGARDRALLLIGWAAALRRSEIATLLVEDCEVQVEGVLVRVRGGKSDPEARGDAVLGVPYGSDPQTCPVRALRRWLELRGDGPGFLFRPVTRSGTTLARGLSGRQVARVVQAAARAAGLSSPEAYGGHSLRSGFATAAAAAGRPERAIAQQTRHKSLVVLRRYIRHGSVWTENACVGIGL